MTARFRGINTRTVTIPASESRFVPTGGLFLSFPEIRNTDPLTKTRPVVAVQTQPTDQPGELIADVRQGDQFRLSHPFAGATLTNLTASEISVTFQAAAVEITRDPPRLPVYSDPWITADAAPGIYSGSSTIVGGNTEVIAPASGIALDVLARTVLLVRVTGGRLVFGEDKYGVTLNVSDGYFQVENATDVLVYADLDPTTVVWTLLCTGVIER